MNSLFLFIKVYYAHRNKTIIKCALGWKLEYPHFMVQWIMYSLFSSLDSYFFFIYDYILNSKKKEIKWEKQIIYSIKILLFVLFAANYIIMIYIALCFDLFIFLVLFFLLGHYWTFSYLFYERNISFDLNRLKWKARRVMLPIRNRSKLINTYFSHTKCPDYMQISKPRNHLYYYIERIKSPCFIVNDLSYVQT